MKTFYCMTTDFYDDGTVKAAMNNRVCEEKPKSSDRELSRMDAYHDWFDTKVETMTFMVEAKTT